MIKEVWTNKNICSPFDDGIRFIHLVQLTTDSNSPVSVEYLKEKTKTSDNLRPYISSLACPPIIFLSPQARRKPRNEIVRLNCAGNLYEIDLDTLHKHPTTLLGNVRLRNRLYCPERDEYFIDRHRPTFETIIDYFNYGTLRRPPDIALDVFVNEVCYYRLEKHAIEDFLIDEGLLLEDQVQIVEKKYFFKNRREKILYLIWECLEDPQSSNLGI